MRFGITGATGFVGSALVHSLRMHGHEVFLITRKDCNDILLGRSLSTRTMSALRRCDALVHLAAVLETKGVGIRNLEHIRKINVELPEKLAKLAIISGVRKFFFVSTAKIFEWQKNHVEVTGKFQANPVIDHYASSKLAAENSLKKFFMTKTIFW